jgi:adenylate kinase
MYTTTHVADPVIIFVIGGPGSGKGTQCEKICKKYGFTHLSTGDLLREEVASGSALGQSCNEVMKKGQLVSDEQVLALLKKAIHNNGWTNGFLVDGYPRNLDQAIAFEKEVGPVNIVLFFRCSDDLMIQRLMDRGLTSGRVDDNEETIKHRLATFHENSDSILENFGEKVVCICAERDPNAIFNDVVRALDTLPKG